MIENIILIIIIILALYWDIRTKKIPNKLILAGLAGGIAAGIYNSGIMGLGSSVIGLLIGIGVLIIPFALQGIGAGDVKLLGIIGAVKGTNFVLNAFLFSAVWGGIISVILLAYKKQLLHILKWIGRGITQLIWCIGTGGKRTISMDALPSTQLSMPYAIPIFLGTITVLLIGGIL